MTFQIVMPHLGATGGDVQIVEWLVREGDFVHAGDPLFTVETDKATEDVPAFREGYIRHILAPAGAELEPGAVVAILTRTADEVVDANVLPEVTSPPEVASAANVERPADRPSTPPSDKHVLPARIENGFAASPRACNLAARHHIDLQFVKPSNPDGVIRAPDVTAAIQARQQAAATEPQRLSQGFLLDAFRRMVLIRTYEEHLYRLFLQGQVPGTLHQCQGQEAVAVGVCLALRADDLIFSSHRPVGHLIAKGASLNALTAEIWGKATGCVGGKGGQMHLADISVGAMLSNAIVGANIPIATGAAMGFRLQGVDRVAVSFFGDGAANIGAFHEGINLAAVQNSPVVFVCENNLYAASTHISTATRITDIADRAHAYGIPGAIVDGMDVVRVYEATGQAVRRARAGQGPTLLECKTYRYRGHSRGDPCGYRDEEEYRHWSQRDPIQICRSRLTTDFGLEAPCLADIERQCQVEVEAAVAFAVASPDPLPSACREHVFVQREAAP